MRLFFYLGYIMLIIANFECIKNIVDNLSKALNNKYKSTHENVIREKKLQKI